MSLKNILKAKTKSQMLEDFIVTHKLESNQGSHQYSRDLKRFAKAFTRPNKTALWTFIILVWIFCLSWMIQAGIALKAKFFWYPIEPGTQSMLSFINIFFVILWFALPTVAIIYSIIKLFRVYDDDN